jgi:hypothetical protein
MMHEIETLLVDVRGIFQYCMYRANHQDPIDHMYMYARTSGRGALEDISSSDDGVNGQLSKISS